jgi:hypothetical protein
MADSDGSDAYTLRPRLPDTARPLHDRLREGLRRCRRQDLCQQDLMRTLLADDALTDLPEPDRLATRLFFEVLEDLARHGWQFDPGVCPGTDEEDPDGEKLCASRLWRRPGAAATTKRSSAACAGCSSKHATNSFSNPACAASSKRWNAHAGTAASR